MLHIRKPQDAEHLEFRPCVHKPTPQWYAIAPEDGAVETIHGTMTFRRGDRILKGVDGQTLYTLTTESYAAAFYPDPDPLP